MNARGWGNTGSEWCGRSIAIGREEPLAPENSALHRGKALVLRRQRRKWVFKFWAPTHED